MKSKLFFLIVFFIAAKILSAQTQWIYTTTPVLSMDTMWGSYGQPTCIFHNDTLRMWYAVAGGVNQLDTVPRGRIHYAWSLDGITWNKYPGNPVLDIGASGQWDDEWLDTPEILWSGNEYKLYYYGDSTYFQGQDNTNIGLATSQDGINWARQGVVLQKGNQGDWDGKFIESPAAYYDTSSGVYALWYSAQDTVGWIKIGLAASSDGINWIKNPTNPCLSLGTFNSWDDMFVAVPAVIKSGDVFEMWYSGIQWATQFDSVRVGYAVSLNGTDWIKYPSNPVLRATNGDSSGFWAVDVVWDSTNNQYKMWYENQYIAGAQAIYYASSPRNILFSNNCNVTASNDTIINQGDSIPLFATGGTFYQWYPSAGLSNPNIANPMASPPVSEVYTIMAVSDSCIATEQVAITVLPLSTSENQTVQMSVNIFPNPSNKGFNVQCSECGAQNTEIKLYDILGREIQMEFSRNEQGFVVQGKNLKQGLYLIKLQGEERIQPARMIRSGGYAKLQVID